MSPLCILNDVLRSKAVRLSKQAIGIPANTDQSCSSLNIKTLLYILKYVPNTCRTMLGASTSQQFSLLCFLG
jgi:hypothetical protein